MPPRLDTVAPGFGFDTNETSIELKGEAFTPRATFRWGTAAADLTTTAAYELFLGEHPLSAVRWLDSRTLTAEVPSGLPPGQYAARLVDPYGVEARLEAAFEIRRRQGARLTAQISTDVAAVRVGAAVVVNLDITNEGDAPADAVVALAGLSSGTAQAVLASVVPGASSLGPGQSRRFQLTWATTMSGEVRFTAEVTGVDSFSGSPLTTGLLTSGPVNVSNPPVLSSTTTVQRRVVSVGQLVELNLEVSNQGSAGVRRLLPAASVAPASLVNLRAAPPPRDVAASARQTFAFTFDSLGPGEATFALSGLGEDDQTGAPVAMAPSMERVTIVRPAALELTAVTGPMSVGVGQRFVVTTRVANRGEAKALSVNLTAVVGGSGAVTLVSAPPALGEVGSLPVEVSWEFDATARGAVVLTFGATGLDENSQNGVSALTLSTAVTVNDPAALTATLSAAPQLINVGQPFTLTLRVHNPGQTDAVQVTPSPPALMGVGSATLSAGPSPQGPVSIAPGSSQLFSWDYSATGAGPIALTTAASGRDGQSMGNLTSPAAVASVQVQRRAVLSTTFSTPSRVNAGQSFEWSLSVANGGDSAANAVAPGPITLLGASLGTPDGGPTPTTHTIPSAGARLFTFAHRAGDAGTLRFQASPAGTDATDGNPVNAPAATSSAVQVDYPARLVGTLAIPPTLVPSAPFFATLRVTNTGEANAVVVAPTALTGGNATLVSGPAPPSATLASDGGVAFTWTYLAPASGTVQLSGSANGLDGNDGQVVSTGLLTSNSAAIGEVFSLGVDPFGDNTAFAYLVSYGGKIWLGPRKTGFGAVSMNPDGTGPANHAFSFARDTAVGQTHANSSPSPYPSIGAPGCATNTAACGPHNENGRGLFFSGRLAGVEWMGVGGATSGALDYVYLTSDTDLTLDFRFVDLSGGLSGSTRGLSAAHAFKDRLYLGFSDTGGNRPFLLSLLFTPPAPGLNAAVNNQLAVGVDALDIEADKLLGLGSAGGNTAPRQMIDDFADFNDRLYVANNGGLIHSTTALPTGPGVAPGDWLTATPSAVAYLAKASRVTPVTSGLLPSDRAFPAIVAFQGKLYAARNTTTGPQLWACTPGADLQCSPLEWALLAANSTGDLLLSQFNNPANTVVSLLAATATTLFVGFNNTAGVVVFKTTAVAPMSQADFTGQAGCVAGVAGCQGLGGDGLGAPALNKQILDSRALSFSGTDWLYLVAGDGTSGVQVWRVPG